MNPYMNTPLPNLGKQPQGPRQCKNVNACPDAKNNKSLSQHPYPGFRQTSSACFWWGESATFRA